MHAVQQNNSGHGGAQKLCVSGATIHKAVAE